MTGKIKILLAIVLTITVATFASVGAASPVSAHDDDDQSIHIQSVLAVTAIEGFSINPETGWARIDRETLQGLSLISVIEGPAELDGLILSAEQRSRERFSTPDITAATALEGRSYGTFSMSVPGGRAVVTGEYELEISNSASCQIYGRGEWETKHGIIDGEGEIEVCTNWVNDFETFVTFVTITGSAELDDDEDEDEDD